MLAVREECDAVHEELAFKESELEETRLELEIEKEKHRVELEDALENAGSDADDKGETKEEADEDADLYPTVDDAYVKKLEDELELVTEQLIETEARLSQTEEKLTEAEEKGKSAEDAPVETSEESSSRKQEQFYAAVGCDRR